MGWMLKNRQPLLINDFQADTRFLKKGEELFKIRSLLCVPLKSKGRMTGIICLFNSKSDAGFSESNQRLLAIVATQSAQVIENARLLEEEQALMKVQEELRLAYDIQMNLLPEKNPEIEGYDLAGRSIPAKEVGGDYYDLIPGEGGQLAFCLGDISGKGLPAALLMASLQATIRGQTILKAAPGACLAHANTLMIQNTSPEKFASLFYGQLDTASHRLIYANAGHNYPLLFSGKKSCRRLESDAIVLGCLEDFDYPEGEVTLAPGDLLLVYSDGITEAFNEKEEEFGEGNLCRVILAHRDLAAADLVDTVINEVQQYAAGLPQHDDITLVIIRRLK
jgi:sigma-B regulation protein RsbU (phosphoserine phosphatase)